MTLTIDLPLTMACLAKLDWPKKRPPISSLVLEAEVAMGSPMKLMLKKSMQCEGLPASQTWQAPQEEKERRTGSPFSKPLMAEPVLTM